MVLMPFGSSFLLCPSSLVPSLIGLQRRYSRKHPRARNDYNEETAYESYMNPEPGFQSAPGDSVDAD